MAVNSAGRICCASPGQGAVLIFPPEGGAHRRIEKGDFPVTNICFGRADGKVAFVTLGSSGAVICIDWYVPGRPLAFGRNMSPQLPFLPTGQPDPSLLFCPVIRRKELICQPIAMTISSWERDLRVVSWRIACRQTPPSRFCWWRRARTTAVR
nr:hypothetical protein [Sphingobium sp.]